MYTIKDAAQILGVSANALRYYETEGLFDPIERDQNGIRHYSDDAIEHIRLRIFLLQMGLTIKEAIAFHQKAGGKETPEKLALRREMLQAVRKDIDAQIQELQQKQGYIDRKLAHLDQISLQSKS